MREPTIGLGKEAEVASGTAAPAQGLCAHAPAHAATSVTILRRNSEWEPNIPLMSVLEPLGPQMPRCTVDDGAHMPLCITPVGSLERSRVHTAPTGVDVRMTRDGPTQFTRYDGPPIRCAADRGDHLSPSSDTPVRTRRNLIKRVDRMVAMLHARIPPAPSVWA